MLPSLNFKSWLKQKEEDPLYAVIRASFQPNEILQMKNGEATVEFANREIYFNRKSQFPNTIEIDFAGTDDFTNSGQISDKADDEGFFGLPSLKFSLQHMQGSSLGLAKKLKEVALRLKEAGLKILVRGADDRRTNYYDKQVQRLGFKPVGQGVYEYANQ